MFVTYIDEDYDCDRFIPRFPNKNMMYSKFYDTFKMKDELSDKYVDVMIVKYYRDHTEIKKENEYLNNISDILKFGHFRKTRNGNTWSRFVKHLDFDLRKGFPLLTTKKMFLKGVFEELMFFINGQTNTKLLSEKGVKIWEQNTSKQFLNSVGLEDYEEGDMGPMYGFNWIHYGAKYEGMKADYTNKGFNQLEYCINTIKNDLYSRRAIMTTFNPAQAKEGCLFPCHGVTIIFNVENENILSCLMVQRSADYIVGVPFNIASYALLLHMICEVINDGDIKVIPGNLHVVLADVHIYEQHYAQAIRQLLRDPFEFPMISFNRKVNSLSDFKFEDINLMNYNSYPAISVKMVA